MNGLLQALGFEGAWLAKAIFETNLLVLFAVCAGHSVWVHGWARTLREFSAGFALTALCESAGVLSGAYVYPGFRFYVLATPVGNPASWVALVYVIMHISDHLFFGPGGGGPRRALSGRSWPLTLLLLALCDATLGLMLDLVLDPLATIFNWWIWVPAEAGVHTIAEGVVQPYNFERLSWMSTPDNPLARFFAPFFEGGFRYPTRIFGIPLINFVAWLVFVFVFSLQFRWVESRDWGHWRKTLVLWAVVLADVPVLGFALIAPNL